MNEDGRRRALEGGDFVLVGPAAVVGQLVALEHRLVEPRRVVRIGHGGVAREHEDRLAAHVHVLVVVPTVFRRDDAVADEHDVGFFHVHFRHEPRRARHEIVGVTQRRRASAGGQAHFWPGDDARQRHFLHETAVRVARLEAEFFELLRDVLDGKLLAARSRRTPAEFIGREHGDVREEVFRVDRVECRLRRRVKGCRGHRDGWRGVRPLTKIHRPPPRRRSPPDA